LGVAKWQNFAPKKKTLVPPKKVKPAIINSDKEEPTRCSLLLCGPGNENWMKKSQIKTCHFGSAKWFLPCICSHDVTLCVAGESKVTGKAINTCHLIGLDR